MPTRATVIVETESWLTACARRATGPFVHDPKDQPRPDGAARPVGYLEIGHQTEGAKPVHRWHRLGAAEQPADRLMHTFYLRYMQALAESERYEAVKVFYPDAEGIMVACVLMELAGAKAPAMCWVGMSARALYVAGIVALGAAPGPLLPEGIR